MHLSHRDRNKKFTNTFQRCTRFPEELPLIRAYCAFPRKAGILGHRRRGPAGTTRPPRLQLTDWPLLAPPSPFCPPYPTPYPPAGARGQPLPWAQLGLAWPRGPRGLLWPWEGQGAPQACWGSPLPGLPPRHGVRPLGAPRGSHTVADRRFGSAVMGVFVESRS